MSFKPYRAPNAGDGPLTVGRDICRRINNDGPEKGKVTPAVISAVAWAYVHFNIPDRTKVEILDGLGLHWQEDSMGEVRLQPKPEFA